MKVYSPIGAFLRSISLILDIFNYIDILPSC